MTTRDGHMIPGRRYKDAPAAIEWLCEAFGFEKRLVVPGDNDTIQHAQLTLGGGMIMVGTARDDEYGELISLPADVGGITAATYIVITDIDAHHDRAVAAGAEIVMPLAEQDHGGSFYSARDPEGHLWNFGSYDPWADTNSD